MANSPFLRNTMIKVYASTCQYCGQIFENNSLQVEHIVPLAKGGQDKLENFTLACNGCNSKKTDIFLPEPFLGLLLGLAERKKDRIQKLLSTENLNVRKASKKENGSEILWGKSAKGRTWGEKEADGFTITYSLPIDFNGIEAYFKMLSHPNLMVSEADIWGCRSYELELRQCDFTDANLEKAINWLFGTRVGTINHTHSILSYFSVVKKQGELEIVSQASIAFSATNDQLEVNKKMFGLLY